MITEYILNKFKDENLKGSLAVGLAGGFIWGLAGGFIWGLAGGLAGGFIWGLAVGLAGGLAYFISFFAFLGLASLISHYPTFVPLWLLIGIGFILMELFFWLDKEKPKKKQNKFWFTTLKKGEALLESVAFLGYLNLARLAIQQIELFNSWDIVLKWIGYIGAGLIGFAILVGIFYLFIKLNSLKYKK